MRRAPLESACFHLLQPSAARLVKDYRALNHVRLNSPLSCDRRLSKLVCSGVAIHSGYKSDRLLVSSRTGVVQLCNAKQEAPFSLRLLGVSVDDRALMPVCLFCSGVPHTDGMFGWYNGEVWDLGHRRTGTLPQPGTDVLQRSSGRYRGLRHHQHRESCDISNDSQELRASRPVDVFKFGLMISGCRRPLLASFSLVFCLNGMF